MGIYKQCFENKVWSGFSQYFVKAGKKNYDQNETNLILDGSSLAAKTPNVNNSVIQSWGRANSIFLGETYHFQQEYFHTM